MKHIVVILAILSMFTIGKTLMAADNPQPTGTEGGGTGGTGTVGGEEGTLIRPLSRPPPYQLPPLSPLPASTQSGPVNANWRQGNTASFQDVTDYYTTGINNSFASTSNNVIVQCYPNISDRQNLASLIIKLFMGFSSSVKLENNSPQTTLGSVEASGWWAFIAKRLIWATPCSSNQSSPILSGEEAATFISNYEPTAFMVEADTPALWRSYPPVVAASTYYTNNFISLLTSNVLNDSACTMGISPRRDEYLDIIFKNVLARMINESLSVSSATNNLLALTTPLIQWIPTPTCMSSQTQQLLVQRLNTIAPSILSWFYDELQGPRVKTNIITAPSPN